MIIAVLFQKRYKKERRFRRKLEQELELNQNNNSHHHSLGLEGKDRSSDISCVDGVKKSEVPQPNGQNSVTNKASPGPGSPATEGEDEDEVDERPDERSKQRD